MAEEWRREQVNGRDKELQREQELRMDEVLQRSKIAEGMSSG